MRINTVMFWNHYSLKRKPTKVCSHKPVPSLNPIIILLSGCSTAQSSSENNKPLTHWGLNSTLLHHINLQTLHVCHIYLCLNMNAHIQLRWTSNKSCEVSVAYQLRFLKLILRKQLLCIHTVHQSSLGCFFNTIGLPCASVNCFNIKI